MLTLAYLSADDRLANSFSVVLIAYTVYSTFSTTNKDVQRKKKIKVYNIWLLTTLPVDLNKKFVIKYDYENSTKIKLGKTQVWNP